MILIDAGHGKDTPGKRSPDSSLMEWEFNREIAKRAPKLSIKQEGKENTGGSGTISDPPPQPCKTIRTLYKSNLLPYQATVETEDDIEKILDDLRRKLEKELKESGEFKLI